jgi:hypothetical protein
MREECLNMVHKRSQTSLARSFILKEAFWDRQRSESINAVSTEQVIGHVSSSISSEEPVDLSAIPVLEKGAVLCDSRGEGAFQD